MFNSAQEHRPLADRLRPNAIADVVGQEHLLYPGKPLFDAIEQGLSLIHI